MIDRLGAELDDVPTNGSPADRAMALGRAYLRFTSANPKLWNLLFEHHLPPGRDIPSWYQQKLDGLMKRVEDVVAPLMPDASPEDIKRSAHVLWAGVHGITSLATADKLSVVTSQGAAPLVDLLVSTYLAGLGRVT
jgi:hypothetical protein